MPYTKMTYNMHTTLEAIKFPVGWATPPKQYFPSIARYLAENHLKIIFYGASDFVKV